MLRIVACYQGLERIDSADHDRSPSDEVVEANEWYVMVIDRTLQVASLYIIGDTRVTQEQSVMTIIG
jgi:hypothetical protein